MPDNAIDVCADIGRSATRAKHRGTDTFERSVNLLSDMVRAKKTLGMEDDDALAALSDAAAAVHSFAEGNRLLTQSHRRLVAVRIEAGIPTASGDECPWPLFEDGSSYQRQGQPSLKVVRNVA